MKTARSLLLVTSIMALLGACDDPAENLDTPRSDLPAELAGDWFTGTLSTIQYYDSYSGEWQDPSGSGFYYVFGDDGDYETGAVIDSTVAGCTMRLLGNEVGTVEIDGDELTVHRHRITTTVSNTCGNDGERTQGQATRVMKWSVAADENGLPWLTLTHEDGTVETYRRWTD